MCKKVIKISEENESIFELATNSLKEITVLLKIDHPCICKGIGINIQEKIDDELTTIAIFTEFLQYDFKKLLEICILKKFIESKNCA